MNMGDQIHKQIIKLDIFTRKQNPMNNNYNFIKYYNVLQNKLVKVSFFFVVVLISMLNCIIWEG